MKYVLLLLLFPLLAGCSSDPPAPAATPSAQRMALEAHVLSVVAEELPDGWPMEALKAQAIVARTNAYRLLMDGVHRFESAPPTRHIGERIRKAVQDTEGLVILHNGQPIHAWYHEHAGGVTASASEGLNYRPEEPAYTRSIQIRESVYAPDDVRSWTAEFPLSQVQKALDTLGGGDAERLAVETRGLSGRAVTFSAGETTVSAVSLRMALGSDRMKSTLIIDIVLQDGQIVISGAGSGHGVGLSQWGAYELAAEGKTAEDILRKFYADIEVASLP